MQSAIKVVCRGTKRSGDHPERTLARYRWSATEGVWERIDQHGSDRDWFIRSLDDGSLQGYPTPRFKCKCGNDPQPTHDELQSRLSLAQAEGKLVL